MNYKRYLVFLIFVVLVAFVYALGGIDLYETFDAVRAG